MRRGGWIPVLLLGGATIALIGALAPWIPHKTAALRIGAFDLFEISKYLPPVRSGEIALLRESFLLPVAVPALLLALVPLAPDGKRGVGRWLLPIAAAIIALSTIPPYPQILSAHQDPEYRGQLVVSAATAILALLSPLAVRLPDRIVAVSILVLTGVGAILPLAQFSRVRPLFATLYHAPVGLGWGIFIYVVGLSLTDLAGVLWLVSSRQE
ncbi:MAG: hypothetical protein PVI59_09065 [Anaerolineae bacterium]|jgi:hypothetical protein